MNTKSSRLVLASMVVTMLVVGGLLLAALPGKGTAGLVHAQPALATEPGQQSTLYLPVSPRNFPARTTFGSDMGVIMEGTGLTKMVNAGTTWMRRGGLSWANIESQKGVYTWDANLDAELALASRRNLEVILLVNTTPAWAQKVPGSVCGPIKQEEFAAFGEFMYHTVARYSSSPYKVKYYEIWNEPDVITHTDTKNFVFGCWGDPGDPNYGGGYYGEMLKVIYPRIKAANPEAQVLVGGLLLDCNPNGGCSTEEKKLPPRFLEGILQAGAGDSFDGISFHAYDYFDFTPEPGKYSNPVWNSAWNTTGPVLSEKIKYIRGILDKHSVTGKYLMNTEVALISDQPSSESLQQAKAYYIPKAYAIGIAEGLRANLWYAVYGWRNSALLAYNGSEYPAFRAYQFAINALQDSAYVGEVTAYQGVKAYEFNRGDRRVWVIWSLDGASHAITLPATPLAIYDPEGNSVGIDGSGLVVTLKPLYVEFAP